MRYDEAIEQLIREVTSKKHNYAREVCELIERRAKYWNPAERRELWKLSQQREELFREMLWVEQELKKILGVWK